MSAGPGALTVSLSPELDEFVRSRVASGHFQSASEVIEEGLRLLEQREQTDELAVEELRAKIRRGTAQAERGELVDGETVFEEIRRLSMARRKLQNQ